MPSSSSRQTAATEPRRYTAETQAAIDAMRARTVENLTDTPESTTPGELRYFLQVETTRLAGTAPVATVIASLRQLADQLETQHTDRNDSHG
jgi:hypothetical protein